jgi:triosephosphate isomerase (TIM)
MVTSRRPLLAANWKMNHLSEQVEPYAAALHQRLPSYLTGETEGWPELCVFPSLLYRPALRGALDSGGVMDIAVGAQDVSAFPHGAHTGEISAAMLAEMHFDMCIVGHSERRATGETDAQVAEKLARLREAGVPPILCVGEGLATREAGGAVHFTLAQLEALRGELAQFPAGGFVIAYEPIWAIGTGRNAEPENAQEMCGAIRGWLALRLDAEREDGECESEVKRAKQRRQEGSGSSPSLHACRTRILYGGSVQPDNILPYLWQADVDGALIGGASLIAEDFAAMAESCATAMREMR